MTTTAPRVTTSPLETAFAGLLASVLQVSHLSVDRNFFDELGADSLVMAQFCARVRKRGDLPPVSMRDVYLHPTVRELAAAMDVAVAARVEPASTRVLEGTTVATAWEYAICGALQALFYLGFSYLSVLAAVEGYRLIVAGSQGFSEYLRLVVYSAAGFIIVCAVPVAAKWLLIGRWRPQSFRIWGPAYLRFWVVKTLIRSNPGVYLFVGSPLYGLYLRALGAKVGRGAVILSRQIPVCTDLLTIGAGTVIRREVNFQGYRARAGRIEIGPLTIGRDGFVGEMSVLDINTAMGDDAQLGHSSSLHCGQAIPARERWHGSPARPTDTNYLRVPPAPNSTRRRTVHGALILAGILLVYAPLMELGVGLLLGASGSATFRGLGIEALVLSCILFFGAILASLLAVGTIPRLLRRFLKPGTVYPLYGFHHAVHRVTSGLSRMKLLPLLFGDSSYIVPFLRWVGYRLSPVTQTGSNFGTEVTTSNPFLTSIGDGTMAADGLNIVTDEISSTSFRVSATRIGRRNFLGNYVNFPAGARTGDNCLFATKVMVPLDGDMREGVGLLGSPPFEIPRSVERDSRYDHLRSGDAFAKALAAKNRFNLRTIGLFLVTRWVGVFWIALIDLAAVDFYQDQLGHAVMASMFALSATVAAVYYAAVEGCFERFTPRPPTICSIYDPAFWRVERGWKLHPIHFLGLFDGTPFKNLLWRLIGVRIGKCVYDDGVYISEPTLTTIGDHAALNHQSVIQCESQEDGTYKSGPTVIGARCTLGVGAFVLYDATMDDGSVLAPDSFLMKGEYVPPRAQWGGNPARLL
ncbi:MAG TPA: Pls/PosA family non-ribosomal peptide synthetase [Gemmatimonadales bacterium]|nr:Pls/PosA family non-ribosomal peptide synthetase [Gemmatimonadales bacterium]